MKKIELVEKNDTVLGWNEIHIDGESIQLGWAGGLAWALQVHADAGLNVRESLLQALTAELKCTNLTDDEQNAVIAFIKCNI